MGKSRDKYGVIIMAYCAKCGVEVDDHIRKCPLCGFPIPDIKMEEYNIDDIRNYPKAENIYREERMKVKNQIFYSILVILFMAVMVFMFVKVRYTFKIVDYFILSSLSLMAYCFFLFGYLKQSYNIVGTALNTSLLLYFINYLSGGKWFWRYGIPITVTVTLSLFITIYLYKLNKGKNRFIYIPSAILVFASLICIGVDILVGYNIKNVITISWSAIVTGINGALIMIMLGINYKLPEKVRIEMKKMFHI